MNEVIVTPRSNSYHFGPSLPQLLNYSFENSNTLLCDHIIFDHSWCLLIVLLGVSDHIFIHVSIINIHISTNDLYCRIIPIRLESNSSMLRNHLIDHDKYSSTYRISTSIHSSIEFTCARNHLIDNNPNQNLSIHRCRLD